MVSLSMNYVGIGSFPPDLGEPTLLMRSNLPQLLLITRFHW